MADSAPPPSAQQPQEQKTVDPAPASPVSAQLPQDPKPAEPLPQNEVKSEAAPVEPDNKEVPPPEPASTPQATQGAPQVSGVAPALAAAVAPAAAPAVAAPVATPVAAPVAAPVVAPVAAPVDASVVAPALATAAATASAPVVAAAVASPAQEKPEAPVAGDNAPAVQNDINKETDWQQRELELLKKIDELEKVKNQRSEDGLRLELKVREEEIDLLKSRVKNLETELQAALSKPSGKNHEMIENIRQQHEELLSKARGMIFDKTKMVKNQELQIEALTTQVQSLKDINLITKDLLEIRNSEVKAMEERFEAMEARFKAEKERYSLVLQRAQTSNNVNDDLRKEYETQLAIFKELREKYEQRVQALVAENAKLKELNLQLKGGPSG